MELGHIHLLLPQLDKARLTTDTQIHTTWLRFTHSRFEVNKNHRQHNCVSDAGCFNLRQGAALSPAPWRSTLTSTVTTILVKSKCQIIPYFESLSLLKSKNKVGSIHKFVLVVSQSVFTIFNLNQWMQKVQPQWHTVFNLYWLYYPWGRVALLFHVWLCWVSRNWDCRSRRCPVRISWAGLWTSISGNNLNNHTSTQVK